MKAKKGQLGSLQGIVLTLVIVGILIGASFFILEEFLTEATDIAAGGAGSESVQAINDTIQAMTTVPALLGLVVLIAVIGVILAVVFSVIPGARVSGA